MNVLNNLYFQNCGPVLEEVTTFPLNPDLGLTVIKEGIVYTYTKIYTSNNDGTFSSTDTNKYSSLHYSIKATDSASIEIDDDNSSDSKVYSSSKIDSELSLKVDKVTGKELSDNNYTDADKKHPRVLISGGKSTSGYIGTSEIFNPEDNTLTQLGDQLIAAKANQAAVYTPKGFIYFLVEYMMIQSIIKM